MVIMTVTGEGQLRQAFTNKYSGGQLNLPIFFRLLKIWRKPEQIKKSVQITFLCNSSASVNHLSYESVTSK